MRSMEKLYPAVQINVNLINIIFFKIDNQRCNLLKYYAFLVTLFLSLIHEGKMGKAVGDE